MPHGDAACCPELQAIQQGVSALAVPCPAPKAQPWWELRKPCALTCRWEKSTVRSTSSSAPSTSRLHRSMDPTPILRDSEAGRWLSRQAQAVSRQLPALSSEPASNLMAALPGGWQACWQAWARTGGMRRTRKAFVMSDSQPLA